MTPRGRSRLDRLRSEVLKAETRYAESKKSGGTVAQRRRLDELEQAKRRLRVAEEDALRYWRGSR